MRNPSFVLARSRTRGVLNQLGFKVGSTMQERAYYRGTLTGIVDSGANFRRTQRLNMKRDVSPSREYV